LTRLFSRKLIDQCLLYVQNPLRLSNQSEPVPDISLLRPRDDDYRAHHPAPADTFLVIEVAALAGADIL
jgi:hypothetical protein